jgi:hypothetical protein
MGERTASVTAEESKSLLRSLAAWPEPARPALEFAWYPGCGSWLQRVLETHLHLHHLTVSMPEERVQALLKTMVASRVTHLTLNLPDASFLPVVPHVQMPQITHLTAGFGQSVRPAVLVMFPALEVLSSLLVEPDMDLSVLQSCPRLRAINRMVVNGFKNDSFIKWLAATTVEELSDIRLTEQREYADYLEGIESGSDDVRGTAPTVFYRQTVQAITSNPHIRYAVLNDAILVDHPVLK